MGSLYLLFAIHAGVDGTLFSMRVRIELALPFVSRVSLHTRESPSPSLASICPGSAA